MAIKDDPRLENCRYHTCDECRFGGDDECPLDKIILGVLKKGVGLEQ